jgi:2-polyprenyl-3-methyl-5-hydroxy-6-metoxy-1,4-benzoquinol methylase/Co/Zn/Cd efflux system component
VSRDDSRDRRHREYVQSCRVAAALRDGPRTLDEISDHFHSYLRVLGLFRKTERLARDQTVSVRDRLGELMERGWVVREGERYALTALGHEEVNKRLSELGKTGALVRKFLQPQTVSKVTLGVHWGLAALKLPAGLLSGSVGMINDATDTLLDGFSSLLVYAGLRFDKERVVNVVLVLLMLVTGGLTFYEAVRRFFVPFEPDVDCFTFLAAILSALVCLLLWAYQRFVGLRSGSMALITQSVDSRNHVIVAASVTAGLVASLLRFPLLDTLVGLAVAVLILKSAVELAIEVVRSLGEEEADLSRYKFGLTERYEQFRQAQLRDWMLYLVEKRGVRTRSELATRAHQALDFSKIPSLRALGLDQQQPQTGEMIEQGMGELFGCGWLVGEEQLSVTEAGKDHLHRQMEGTRGKVHRLSPAGQRRAGTPSTLRGTNEMRRKKMSRPNRMHFKMMSFVHETLYGLFRDPRKVLNAVGLEPGQKVLEVGCGPGFFTIPAAKIVGESGNIYALDVNPLAVERVQQKIEKEGVTNVKTILADAAQTGLPDQSFDLAFVFGFARPIGNLDDIWTELYRLLRPKGILSIEGRLRPSERLFYPVKRRGRISLFRKVG